MLADNKLALNEGWDEDLVASVESSRKILHDPWLDTAITYKAEWEKELCRREQMGSSLPELLPHPYHMKIDMIEGTASFVGPANRQKNKTHTTGSLNVAMGSETHSSKFRTCGSKRMTHG